MAPRKAATTTLSSMLETYSDDEIGNSTMLPTPDSQTENRAPTTKRSAAAATNKTNNTVVNTRITKSKVPSRRNSGASVITATKGRKPAATKGRKALKELENVNDAGNETEEVDEFAEEDREDVAPSRKRGRPAKTVVAKSQQVGSTVAGGKRIGGSKTATRAVHEVQPEEMQVDDTGLGEVEIDDTIVPARPASRPTARPGAPTTAALQPISSSRPGRRDARQPIESLLHSRKRAGSASSTERAADPTLRRKLGDMTKRFESLDLKYRQLKEVGSAEALSNFDKLRRTTDQRAKDQDAVIDALKKQLAAQTALLADTKTLQSQLVSLQAENSRLQSEQKSLSTSLQSSQTESRNLSAKLHAIRSSAPPEMRSGPGSAVKNRGAAGNVTRGEEAQTMKLKEDLYSDLTGLMIRKVSQGEEEDVYDCIQTGRNGTLRFHLSISHVPSASLTPGPANSAYDDTEFGYMPVLDEKNDRELLDILPDYLTEEIAFPRSQAAKFFGKLSECMSRRVELED